MHLILRVKGKALYPEVSTLFCMMQEIMKESRLEDEKRLKEILAMTKSRLEMSLPVFRPYGQSRFGHCPMISPMSKFKDDTDGIGFYQTVARITGHFEEEKETLIQNLKNLVAQIFTADQSAGQLHQCGRWNGSGTDRNKADRRASL